MVMNELGFQAQEKVNHKIAYDFISKEITVLRAQTYADLVERIGKCEHKEFVGQDGNLYQLEIEVLYDSGGLFGLKRGSDIRVMVCADGGGVSAMLPVSDSFIMAPDGSFVGESFGGR